MDIGSGLGYGDAAAATSAGEATGDSVGALRGSLHLAMIELFMGASAAEATMVHIAEEAERLGDRWTIAMALRFLAVTQILLHDRYEDARPLVEKLEAMAKATGSEMYRLLHAFVEGIAALRTGRLKEAATSLEEALRLGYAIGDPGTEVFLLDAAVESALARGDLSRAWTFLEASRERMRRSAPGRAEVIAVIESAILLAEGSAAGAADRVRGAVDVVRQLGGPMFTAAALLRLARAERALANEQPARAAVDEAIAIARQAQMPWMLVEALVLQGSLTVAGDENERAEAAVHEALSIAADRRFVPAVAASLLELAARAVATESHLEAARLTGASDGIRDAIGWALAADEQSRRDAVLGAARDAIGEEAVDQAWAEGAALSVENAVAYAQRARGERKRPTTGWASLTPTESQVVAVAVEGLTNAEIARRLFMSPATVKTHLAHVYAKLGVSSRAQLATIAHRRSEAR